MKNEVLVRIYKVGCGDCIFVRIPDEDRPYHMLIDCGNFFGDKSAELKEALGDVEKLLNDEENVPEEQRGHLDLLVATHEHWDHIKGFEAALDFFKRIKIERIWLTVGMEKDNPQTLQLRALQSHVEKTIERINKEPNLRLNPGFSSLLMMMSLSTKRSSEVLREDLPEHHDIKPLYVYRGFEDDLPEADKEKYLLQFKDPKIKLNVLAPEKEIDDSYVTHSFAMLDDLGKGENCFEQLVPEDQRIEFPTNISRRQFRNLQTQMVYSSLMAAKNSNHVVNNTSVVLLLEWKGKRLLFPGDAEHESWVLMWEKSKKELNKKVDFLKVSHHGSYNGTPYHLSNPDHQLNNILNAILPKDNANKATAVVPTLAGRIHSVHNPVPHPDLMNELAARVKNHQPYPEENGNHPERTDKLKDEEWIDIKIK